MLSGNILSSFPLFWWDVWVRGCSGYSSLIRAQSWDFPGSAVARTLELSLLKAQVQSLVGELRSHKLHSAVRGEKKREREKEHKGILSPLKSPLPYQSPRLRMLSLWRWLRLWMFCPIIPGPGAWKIQPLLGQFLFCRILRSTEGWCWWWLWIMMPLKRESSKNPLVTARTP